MIRDIKGDKLKVNDHVYFTDYGEHIINIGYIEYINAKTIGIQWKSSSNKTAMRLDFCKLRIVKF